MDQDLPTLVECLDDSVRQGFIKGYGRLLTEGRRPELIPAASREVFNLESEAEQSLDFALTPGAPTPLA